ncbi:TPA: hypothetical protein RQK73_000309 [Vibrio vulnificus]|nr:hypothetical protein [Vibrio vulnificus]
MTTRRVQGYPSTALTKSSAGIGTPNDSKGVRRQLFAGFFVACDSAHPNYGGLDEAASAGRFLLSGSTNLVQFTTRVWYLAGELLKSKGASHDCTDQPYRIR